MRAEDVNSLAEQHWQIHASLIQSERHHYQFLEVQDNSMNDGSSKALCIGDVLNCREIEQWGEISDLNNLKYPVVVVTPSGNKVGIITGYEVGKIILHRRNPAHKDLRILCSEIKAIYLVESSQRDMTPDAEAKRSKSACKTTKTA